MRQEPFVLLSRFKPQSESLLLSLIRYKQFVAKFDTLLAELIDLLLWSEVSR
jgi:hypothetical protein